jgi:4-diphosphocytidyl-2-C-methyl-D-erythritol kinase
VADLDGLEESSGWRLAAPAKLNLWLTVVGRRADGFHELDSLLVLLELADELSLAHEGPELRIGGPAAAGVPVDRTNLAWRGWVEGLAGRTPAGGLSVDKRVPAAAGLGGGSSDAAAARRLARWVTGRGDDPPAADELVTLAAIGADVPFFASLQAVARVGGIGERVTPDATAGPAEVILVHPPFGLATGAVFAELRPSEWSGPTEDVATRPGRNDLAAPARRLRSELDDIFRLVAGAGGEPHLTGSGPTVFALTDDPERAGGVASRLERAGLATTHTRLRLEPASIER